MRREFVTGGFARASFLSCWLLFYLEWLESWRDKDVIKVITGIRQVSAIDFLLEGTRLP